MKETERDGGSVGRGMCCSHKRREQAVVKVGE